MAVLSVPEKTANKIFLEKQGTVEFQFWYLNTIIIKKEDSRCVFAKLYWKEIAVLRSLAKVCFWKFGSNILCKIFITARGNLQTTNRLCLIIFLLILGILQHIIFPKGLVYILLTFIWSRLQQLWAMSSYFLSRIGLFSRSKSFCTNWGPI